MPFELRPTDAEELEEGDPHVIAVENARRKALAARAAAPADAHVLAVDTVVALDGAVYGKPAGEDEARATLRALAGRTHQVVGGLVLDDRATVAVTNVTFRDLDDALVDWYVATGEWRDRAGGYAIQGRGAVLVRAIEGDYLNVVGLPVAALMDVLESSAFRA